MSRASAIPLADRNLAALLDRRAVQRMLRDSIEWPDGSRPRDVSLERCWPDRHGGFSFEWSFRLAGRRRHSLYGSTCQSDGPDCEAHRNRAVITAAGVCDLCVYIRDRHVLIHSRDRDPRLPQVAECLDGQRMAPRLAQFWETAASGEPSPDEPTSCRLLAYRAGRRAAVAYRRGDPGGSTLGLIGKLRRRPGGTIPAQRNARLNEQLAWFSNRRVRVPAVIGEIPELHLTLAAEARGRRFGERPGSFAADALRAVGALATLQLTSLDLPSFGARDELAIVRHWFDAIKRIEPDAASHMAPVVDILERHGAGVEDAPACTIHRDFYERQLVFGRRSTTIVDLDTLALGDPCLDVANLIAHLHLASLMSRRRAPDTESLSADLVERYEFECRPLDRRSLAFYAVSSALRVGAVHAVRSRTRVCAAPMFALARRLATVLDGGGGNVPAFLRPRHVSRLAAGPDGLEEMSA